MTSDNNVYTWGLGMHGQLGLGEGKANTFSNSPVLLSRSDFSPPLAKNDHVVRTFCGDFYTAFVTSKGVLYTCGHNQAERLGHKDLHIFQPTQVAALRNKPCELIGCGPREMMCFIPTRLLNVNESCVDISGGTPLELGGIGIYDINGPIQVSFEFAGRQYHADGEYSSEKEKVFCISPTFHDPQDNKPLQEVYISVSLDGHRYSNSLAVAVFRSPDVNQISLAPSHGPFSGGTQACISAPLDHLDYSSVRVRLTVQSPAGSSDVILPGTFEPATRSVWFTTPPVPAEFKLFASDLEEGSEHVLSRCETQVALSLDGTQFQDINHTFSFYDPRALSVVPEQVGFDGDLIFLTCSGVHAQGSLSIRFHVNNSSDPDRQITLPAAPASGQQLGKLVYDRLDTEQVPAHMLNIRSTPALSVAESKILGSFAASPNFTRANSRATVGSESRLSSALGELHTSPRQNRGTTGKSGMSSPSQLTPRVLEAAGLEETPKKLAWNPPQPEYGSGRVSAFRAAQFLLHYQMLPGAQQLSVLSLLSHSGAGKDDILSEHETIQLVSRLKRYSDNVLKSNPNLAKQAIVPICLHTPRFARYGACQVGLQLSLNEADFVPLEVGIEVRPPLVQRVVPSCGPIAGGTAVQLQGVRMYPSLNIKVKFDQLVQHTHHDDEADEANKVSTLISIITLITLI